MSVNAEYGIVGTAALKPDLAGAGERRRLRVYEGGRGVRACSRRHRAGRPLVAVVAAALAFAGVLLAASLSDEAQSSAAAARMDSAPREVVYVQPGDTLWSIASREAGPQTSTERVVSWIMEANGLSDATLRPGTELVVPVLAP